MILGPFSLPGRATPAFLCTFPFRVGPTHVAQEHFVHGDLSVNDEAFPDIEFVGGRVLRNIQDDSVVSKGSAETVQEAQHGPAQTLSVESREGPQEQQFEIGKIVFGTPGQGSHKLPARPPSQQTKQTSKEAKHGLRSGFETGVQREGRADQRAVSADAVEPCPVAAGKGLDEEFQERPPRFGRCVSRQHRVVGKRLGEHRQGFPVLERVESFDLDGFPPVGIGTASWFWPISPPGGPISLRPGIRPGISIDREERGGLLP